MIALLSIDGGGILGIVPLMMLDYLEEKTGMPTASLFKLIAGTSTGGLITLGLTLKDPASQRPKYTAKQLLDLYENKSFMIFQKSTLGNFLTFSSFLSKVYQLFATKYTASGMEEFFKDTFKDALLSEALTNIFIPAYNLEKNNHGESRLKLFKSYKKHILDKNYPFFQGDYFVRDIAQATCAAPLYFPYKIIRNKNKTYFCIDGSIVVHDPSLMAYLEALCLFPNKKYLLLSLGTGPCEMLHKDLQSHERPGLWAWREVIPHLATDPNGTTQRLVLKKLQFLQKNLDTVRLVPPSRFSLERFDDISKEHIVHLKNVSHQMIQEKKHVLNALACQLKEWIS